MRSAGLCECVALIYECGITEEDHEAMLFLLAQTLLCHYYTRRIRHTHTQICSHSLCVHMLLNRLRQNNYCVGEMRSAGLCECLVQICERGITEENHEPMLFLLAHACPPHAQDADAWTKVFSVFGEIKIAHGSEDKTFNAAFFIHPATLVKIGKA